MQSLQPKLDYKGKVPSFRKMTGRVQQVGEGESCWKNNLFTTLLFLPSHLVFNHRKTSQILNIFTLLI